MTEIRPAPRAMKNPIDLRLPATTITPAYARQSRGAFAKVLGGFSCGGCAGDAGHLDGSRDAEELENTDEDPGMVELIPGQAVPGRRGMRVVIVVPAFAERKKSDPPAITGIVPGFKPALAPHVGRRIDQPSGVQADHYA